MKTINLIILFKERWVISVIKIFNNRNVILENISSFNIFELNIQNSWSFIIRMIPNLK